MTYHYPQCLHALLFIPHPPSLRVLLQKRRLLLIKQRREMGQQILKNHSRFHPPIHGGQTYLTHIPY